MKGRCALFLLATVLASSGLLVGCQQPKASVEEPVAPAVTTTATVAPPTTNEPAPQADKIQVPDIVGFGALTARLNLAENHLSWKIVTDPPGTKLPIDNESKVVKQDPAAGEIVDSGSTITFTIKKR